MTTNNMILCRLSTVHSNTCDIGMVHVLSLPNSLFASHTHNYFTLHGPPHPGYSLTVNKCTSLLSLASRSWHPLCLLLQFLQLFKRAAIVVTSMIITSDLALQVLSMVANSAKISEKPERVQMINQHTPWELMAFAFTAIFTCKYIKVGLARNYLTVL